MSITVKDCLQLPSLSLGNVIAGHNGLSNIVNTVSVVEFENYDESFNTANELLITAFYSIRNDVKEQCRAIEEFKRSGEVGLVLFYSDLILKHVDQSLIDTANRTDFPIILLPGENMGLRYSDVINDIMEAIFMDRQNSNFFVNNTMERISQLPSSERNIANVLQFASDYAKSAFFLCDQNKNVLGSSYWPQTNVLNFENIQAAFNDKDSSLQHNQPNPYNFFKMQFSGKRGVHLTLYGVTRHDILSTAIMNQVIEIIRLFAAIWNYNLNLSTKESLIPTLIEGNYDLALHIANDLNVDISHYTAMMILDIRSKGRKTSLISHILDKIHNIFESNGRNYIADSFGSHIIILGSYERNNTRDIILLEELSSEFSRENNIKYYSFFNSLEHLKNVRKAYVVYCDSIDTACRIYPSKKFFTDSEIYFAEKCLSILNTDLAERENYLRILRPIIEDSEEDLLLTLSAYMLDADSETKKTAELLFVHRNTIQYRLSKIRNLINMNFNKLPMAYDVYMAVALNRALL